MSRRTLGRRPLVATALVAVLGAALAACGTAADDDPDRAGTSEDGFPLTLEHALGSTVIEERPRRVFAIGEDLDSLVAVGVTPVGYAPLVPGTTDVPYLSDVDLSGAEVVEGYETGELSVESIAALRPDLILGTNFFGMPEVYDQLSKIAPTVAYEKGWGESSWQDLTRTIGRAVGEEDAAETAIAETEDYLSELRADLPGLEGKTVAGVNYYQEGVFASNPRSASMDKFLDLGMRVNPDLLAAKPEGSEDNSISLEQIEVLDADYLMVGFPDDGLRRSLEANPLYRGLKAVRQGTVRVVDPEDTVLLYAGNTPSVLNIPWVLEQQRDDLARVAATG